MWAGVDRPKAVNWEPSPENVSKRPADLHLLPALKRSSSDEGRKIPVLDVLILRITISFFNFRPTTNKK